MLFNKMFWILDPVTFDEISLVFDIPADFGGQKALGDKLITRLFWTNKFNDWSE